MGEFCMPSLGADMDAGTVVQWLVEPGDEVHKGDIVAVVDTDKADVDVEIFEDGRVREILVPAGEKVPVGTPLATLSPVGAAAPVGASPANVEPGPEAVAGRPATPATLESSSRAAPAPAAGLPRLPPPPVRRIASQLGVELASVTGTGPGGAITRQDVERAARPAAEAPPRRVSPRARRLAGELGVDVTSATGSGPSGAITGDDIEQVREAATVESTPPPPAAGVIDEGPTHRADTMRQAIARLMARSKREIPHYYLETTIDFGPARAWLDATNEARPVGDRLLPAALLLKATAVALRAVPQLNGFWVDDAWQPSEHIHLGVAVSLRGGGLLAPAIHDADTLALDDLMRDLRDVVNRARTGRLRSSEMTDPTITVTNLGDQGVEAVYGIIFPPQVAIVGFGAVTERPWARDGMIGTRPVVRATLAADHRASDGAVGARLLAGIDKLLRQPAQL